MAGHRDNGTFAEDKAHHPGRKVDRASSSTRYGETASGQRIASHGKCSHCDEKGPVTLMTAYNRDAELCPTCEKLYDEDQNNR